MTKNELALPTATIRREADNDSMKRGNTPPPNEAPPRNKSTVQQRITLEGILFIMTALVIGFAATNTGANLLYLVLSMMLAMLIVSGILTRANIKKLTIKRRYPQEFQAGQDARGVVEIHNGKRLTHSFALRVEEEVTGPVGAAEPRTVSVHGFALIVPAKDKTICPITFNLPARGQYTIQQGCLTTRYPFSLFVKTRVFPDQEKLLVFPKLIPTVSLLPHCQHLLGEHENNRKGHGSGIFGIRNYDAGDSSRIIHWKHSAKGQGLKVKEFEHEDSRSFRIMLDLRCLQEGKTSAKLLDDFEAAVSVAASLARLMLTQNIIVGMWTSIGNIPMGAGQPQQQRILRALAQVQPQPLDGTPVYPARTIQSMDIWIEYFSAGDAAAGTRRFSSPGSFSIDARKVIAGAITSSVRI